MTITVLLTVAGIVVIFVEIGGWSSVSDKINLDSLQIRKPFGGNIVFQNCVQTTKTI